MLVAFFLFGSLLSDALTTIPHLPTFMLAVFVIFVARPVAIGLALRCISISRRARIFIGWFGPRGLSMLLFSLLLVSNGVQRAEPLLPSEGVVIVSVFLHGISIAPLAARYGRSVQQAVSPEERVGTSAGLFQAEPAEVPRISPQELAQRLASEHPPIVLDVRSRSSFAHAETQIPGSVLVMPDEVMDWAMKQPRDHRMVTYCT